MPRARVTVAYDGSAFHGFAPNIGVATVSGTISAAIARVLGREVELTSAGRTDAGVHGWGQVVSLDLPVGTDLDDLVHRVNRMCRPSVAVRDPQWVGDEFDARFSAVWRHYRYTILNGVPRHPLLTGVTWHVAPPLDLEIMQASADALVGEHDFSSFCRRPKLAPGQPPVSLVRRVLSTRWSHVDGDSLFEMPLIRFEIRANAFCHQMVRSIVGTMIDIGQGKLHAGDLRAIMLAADRSVAGQVAPPHGLTLWQVGY